MRISENQKEILKVIGGTLAFSAIALIAPNILQLLKPKNKNQRYRYKKSLEKLIENKVIYLSGDKVKLTKKGRHLLNCIGIDQIEIKKQTGWDGVWHLICYDIPETMKRERNFFQCKLLESGFWAVQDSLWTYPWDCKEEIAVIARFLGVEPYVAYMTTDHLPDQEKLIKIYKLQTH